MRSASGDDARAVTELVMQAIKVDSPGVVRFRMFHDFLRNKPQLEF